MKKIIYKIAEYFYNRYLKKEIFVKYKHGINFRNNSHIDTLNPQFIEIGDNFISAPGSLITAHDASLFLFKRKYRIEKVKIGNNVFLGANSVVLPGVTIGDNVIIGAGAVVSNDIPANSVYAGNPAKYICTIAEYVTKCETRNVLYNVPKNFVIEYESGKAFSQNSIEEFQDMALKDYVKRLKNAES
jgi:acetyltransferase-like isoleucine patch superfamily enzyme